jgi:hydroxymethylbilane synthase
LIETLTIGARGSPLSLAQTQAVAQELTLRHPDLRVVVRPIATGGDDLLAQPKKLGLKGLFVREIEKALLAGEIDLAVHSAKDLPIKLPKGLALGPTPARGPAEDALVAAEALTLAELPKGSLVGTSSLRRKAQLLASRPDLEVAPVRGNLGTRLAKLKRGDFAALVLAEAGLARLNLSEWPRGLLDPVAFTPAPGQGALALETRADDSRTLSLLAPLNHPDSALALALERGAAEALGLGCETPAAAYARPEGAGFRLAAMVARTDGGVRVYRETFVEAESLKGSLAAARVEGLNLGQAVLRAGGAAILAELAEEAAGPKPLTDSAAAPSGHPFASHDR